MEIWFSEEAEHLFIKIDGVFVDKMQMVERCQDVRKNKEEHFHSGNLQ